MCIYTAADTFIRLIAVKNIAQLFYLCPYILPLSRVRACVHIRTLLLKHIYKLTKNNSYIKTHIYIHIA